MEDIVFSEKDITEDFLEDILENYSTEGEWDEWDLIAWIREIQLLIVDHAARTTKVPLKDYIGNYFDDRPDLVEQPEFVHQQFNFANKQDVRPSQVTEWLKKGFFVVDDFLYPPSRDLHR